MVVCEWPESFRFRRSQRKRLWGRGMATSLVHGPVTLKRGKLRTGRPAMNCAFIAWLLVATRVRGDVACGHDGLASL